VVGSRWRKLCVAIVGREFVVRRVDWKQMSRKRHTEATPPSHVPDELLAMRRGMCRGSLMRRSLVGAQGQSWDWATHWPGFFSPPPPIVIDYV
jgi:hypothetical protein